MSKRQRLRNDIYENQATKALFKRLKGHNILDVYVLGPMKGNYALNNRIKKIPTLDGYS